MCDSIDRPRSRSSFIVATAVTFFVKLATSWLRLRSSARSGVVRLRSCGAAGAREAPARERDDELAALGDRERVPAA
jgi:hypothetical protein